MSELVDLERRVLSAAIHWRNALAAANLNYDVDEPMWSDYQEDSDRARTDLLDLLDELVATPTPQPAPPEPNAVATLRALKKAMEKPESV